MIALFHRRSTFNDCKVDKNGNQVARNDDNETKSAVSNDVISSFLLLVND